MDQLRKNQTPLALVVSALILGGSLVWAALAYSDAIKSARYEIAAPGQFVAYRLDRRTGDVWACRSIGKTGAGDLEASPSGATCWQIKELK